MKTKDEVMRMLHQLFPKQETLDRWLDSPQPALCNRTPRSVIEEDGGTDAVFTLVDRTFTSGGL